MNEPLEWEPIVEGGRLVRAKLDGKGWIVAAVNSNEEITAMVYVPDENNKWGE